MESQLLNIRNNKNLISALLAVVLFAGGAAGLWVMLNRSNSPVTLTPDDIQTVAQGQNLYKDNCASCHGEKLEGQPNWKSRNDAGLMPAPPHDQSGHTWHHADVLLFELTKFGLSKFAGADYKSDMPVFSQTMTDQEIIAVLSFIKSTWPQEVRKKHDQINKAYKQRNENS